MAKTTKPSPKVNLFAQAKANPTTKGSSSNKAEPAPVELKGIKNYAYMASLKKTIESTMKVGLRPELDERIFDEFIRNRGVTFKAFEDSKTDTTTVVFSKRQSNSGLKDEELAILEKHHIPTARIEGDFKINAEGVSEAKLIEVSEAISAIKGLPKNFIEFDDSKARTVVTEESIAAVYRLNDFKTIKELLKIVVTPMIKPKTSAKIEKILDAVADLLVEVEEEA